MRGNMFTKHTPVGWCDWVWVCLCVRVYQESDYETDLFVMKFKSVLQKNRATQNMLLWAYDMPVNYKIWPKTYKNMALKKLSIKMK